MPPCLDLSKGCLEEYCILEIASDNNKELMALFYARCREHHIVCDTGRLFAYLHEFPESPGYEQLSLF